MLRQRIFHLGRDYRINFASNDFVAFQVAQMLRQHFLGHAGNQLAKFSKSLGPAFEIKKDERLPLAANHVRGQLHRTIELFHLSTQGYKKVPTGKKDTLAYNRRLNQKFLWTLHPTYTAGCEPSPGQAARRGAMCHEGAAPAEWSQANTNFLARSCRT